MASRRRLQRFEPEAEMRYVGQEHAVALPLPDHAFTPSMICQDLMKRFNVLHQRHYGHSMEDPVEFVTLRLRGNRPVAALPDSSSQIGSHSSPAARQRRPASCTPGCSDQDDVCGI